ncbi:cytochrome P450 [Umbelopsis sp. PMI_123]|nr:cytochrome P450 [Umbelopsis sp. PMI_123]
MDKLQPVINDSLERFNSLTRHGQFVGAIGLATVVVLSSYLIKPASKNYPPFVSEKIIDGVNIDNDLRKWLELASKKYGDTFRAKMFGMTITVVGKENAREVFLNDDFSFTKAVADKFDATGMIGINNPEKFDRLTTIITRHLTPNLNAFNKRVNEQVLLMLDKLVGPTEGEPKVIPHLFPFVQDIVARSSTSVFAGEELCKNDTIVNCFGNVTFDIGSNLKKTWLMDAFPSYDLFYQRYIFPRSATVRKHRKNAKEILTPVIEERVRHLNDSNYERSNDMLQIIIEQHDPTEDWGSPYTDFIINYMFILVFVSIHTTTENTTHTLYYLMKHPEYIQELIDEQKRVLEEEGTKDKDVKFTYDVLKKLTKLDSFIREVFRMRTIELGLQHKNITKHDITLSNGYVIPPGQNVYINMWDVGRNAELQGEDVEEFRPWRFVESAKQAVRIGNDNIFFGLGKHACPGRFMAVNSLKITVSNILHNYELSADSEITLPTTFNGMPMGSVAFKKRVD